MGPIAPAASTPPACIPSSLGTPIPGSPGAAACFQAPNRESGVKMRFVGGGLTSEVVTAIFDCPVLSVVSHSSSPGVAPSLTPLNAMRGQVNKKFLNVPLLF